MALYFLTLFLLLTLGALSESGTASVNQDAEITEAPDATSWQLHKRDIDTCGYIDGNTDKPVTCSSGLSCHASAVRYASHPAVVCGDDIPWGYCVAYGETPCPDISSCSSRYGVVGFCNSMSPYCAVFQYKPFTAETQAYYGLACQTSRPASAPEVVRFGPASTTSPATTTTPTTTTPTTTTPTTTTPTTTTPTTTTPTTPAPTKTDNGGLSAGAVAGISIGSLAFAGIGILIGFMGFTKTRRKQGSQ